MTYKEWEPILLRELKIHMSVVSDLREEHDVDHVLRIWKKCEILRKTMKVNMEKLIAIILL